MGTHLKFSTSCHPQMNGQIDVTHRTLGTLLRVLAKKNTKGWDELLSHAQVRAKIERFNYQTKDGVNTVSYTHLTLPTKRIV